MNRTSGVCEKLRSKVIYLNVLAIPKAKYSFNHHFSSVMLNFGGVREGLAIVPSIDMVE